LHTLIPRRTDRWKKLYRLRGAVERENGRLNNELGLLPLRVRRLERVQLHVDLTILARLATALAKARAMPLTASPPRRFGVARTRPGVSGDMWPRCGPRRSHQGANAVPACGLGDLERMG
jgi:hypothetical protein